MRARMHAFECHTWWVQPSQRRWSLVRPSPDGQVTMAALLAATHLAAMPPPAPTEPQSTEPPPTEPPPTRLLPQVRCTTVLELEPLDEQQVRRLAPCLCCVLAGMVRGRQAASAGP